MTKDLNMDNGLPLELIGKRFGALLFLSVLIAVPSVVWAQAGPDGTPPIVAPVGDSESASDDKVPTDMGPSPTPTEAATLEELEMTEDDMLELERLLATPLESLLKIYIAKASAVDVPYAITIITRDEIMRAGYESVGEALREVPGFHGIYDHVLFNIGVRGVRAGARGGSSILKVMIDGQPVPFRTSMINLLGREAIPLAMVDRIEVLRGPNSVLYGANAFMGVVNIVTRDSRAALEGSSARVQVLGRGFGGDGGAGLGGEVVLLAASESFSLSLGISVYQEDRSGLKLPQSSPRAWVYINDDVSKNDLARPVSVYGSAVLRDFIGGTLTLRSSLQRLDSGTEFQDLTVLTHSSRTSVSNAFVGLEYDYPITDKWSVVLSGAYAEGQPTSADRLNIRTTQANDFFVKRRFHYWANDLAVESRFRFAEDQGSLSVGFDFSRDKERLMSSNRVEPSTGAQTPNSRGVGTRVFENFGGSTNLTYYLFDGDLGLNGGVRIDGHSVYGINLTARLGAVFRLPEVSFLDSGNVKVFYSSSFKAPSAEELYGTPIKLEDIRGDDSIKAQRADAIELATHLAFTEELVLDLTAYAQKTSNTIDYIFTGLELKPINYDAWYVGGEASITATGTLSPIKLLGEAHFSYVRQVDLTIQSGGVGIYSTTFPEWIAGATLGIEAVDFYLSLRAMLDVVGPRHASQSNSLIGGSLGYELEPYPDLSVTLSTIGLTLFEGRETILMVRVRHVLGGYTEPGFNGIDIPTQGATFRLTLSQEL